MRNLLIAILILLTFEAEAARGGRGRGSCGQSIDTIRIIEGKLKTLHRLKGTFETLFPIEPNSVAWRFPELYERLLRLFNDRPSHLLGLNRGNAPQIGTPMTEIFQRMTDFAHDIGKDIRFFAVNSIPNKKDPALRLILDYADRFESQRTRLSRTAPGCFHPSNGRQLADISRFGKNSVCSLWAELRLSLRIGRLSLTNVSVANLVTRGIINDPGGYLYPYYDQQIDHVWFPYHEPGLMTGDGDLLDDSKLQEDSWSTRWDYQPDAVAIGDSKVFDSVFDANHQYRDDMHDQLKRYLKIASHIGATLGIPPRVYYFFVAGISKDQIAELNRITDDFNRNLKRNNIDPKIQSPVTLFLYGDYDLIRVP